jgi:hypothetical protein
MSIKFSRFCFAVVFATLFLYTNLFSQAGGASVPFLRISPDARSSGMGETGTAIADNANAVYWNPGGLGFLDYFNIGNEFEDAVPFRQVSLSFSPWLPQFNADLYYSYASVVNHFEDIGTVAANFRFMNLGNFVHTDEVGNKKGEFTSNEFAFSVAFGTKITEELGIGANLQYIRSNLTPALNNRAAAIGNSASLDLGLLWKPQNLWFMEDNFSFGFNLQTLGPKITYISESDPLPTNIKVGLAYTIFKDEFNDLKVAVDLQKLLVRRDTAGGSDPVPYSLFTAWRTPGIETAFGLEYWYEKIIAIRGGYFTEPSNLGGRQFWNVGAGVRYKIFQLDFGYILTINENHPLANTMRFSLLIDWK